MGGVAHRNTGQIPVDSKLNGPLASSTDRKETRTYLMREFIYVYMKTKSNLIDYSF